MYEFRLTWSHFAAGIPNVCYVYRPVFLQGCASKAQSTDQCADLGSGPYVTLPGFGVEMAVKNMEYSALDDRKVSPNDKAFIQQMKIALQESLQ